MQLWRRQRNIFKQVMEHLAIHLQQRYPYLPIPLLTSVVHRLREHHLWRDVHRHTATPLCHQWPAQFPRPEAHRISL